jgi:Flp pilus assembly protein TadG
MRVRERTPLALQLHREEGATAVIVVLSLVALLGLIVLTVDVGQLLFRRRGMVNASDSAALAAAQSCAGVDDTDVPEIMADTFAGENVNGLRPFNGGITDLVGCDGPAFGHVSVEYQTQQDLFFAGVLGFTGPAQVKTAATAGWGPARRANPLPIVVYTGQDQGNCDIDEGMTPGTPCYLWYDNDLFANSAFGFLNLCTADDRCQQGWDVDPGAQCPNVGASLRDDWISGNWDGAENRINFPGDTYVCRVSGLASSDWSGLEDRVGDDLLFPVNDCTKQVDKNGSPTGCFGAEAPDKYDIIGFMILNLEAVLDSAAEWGGTPYSSCSINNMNVTRNQVIALSSLPGGGCPNGRTPSGVENLLVGGQAPGAPGAQYIYNSTTQMIQWTGPNGRTNISFNWWQDGECGAPPGNSSAGCLKVRTVQEKFAGREPCSQGQGCPDFGVRAVRLCDLDFRSCPENG